MKRIFTLLTLTILGSATVFAQSDCSGGRYSTYNLFSGVDVANGVTFGSNSGTTLKMDVYTPTGDSETNRAVVIVAFGGSFISGFRTDQSVVDLCTMFAKMGYVAVAPDYRRGFFVPSEVTTTLAVMKCMHDLKACVRYLKKTAAEDGNPYGLDCGRIVVGGISAGAIGAIHTAYMDKLTEVPSYMQNDTAGLGGVEGLSGTPNYYSDVIGVMSLSGAIGDTLWIEEGDVAIVSVHEEDDNVVPYHTQEVSVSGFPTGLTASGSGDLHLRAAHMGVENALKSYPGVQNHVGYLGDQTAIDFFTSFLADLVCSGETDNCAMISSGISEVERNAISVYPNPTKNVLTFTVEEVGTVEVIDATGRTVLTSSSTLGQNRLDVSSLPTGVYTLRTIGEKISTAHFVKE